MGRTAGWCLRATWTSSPSRCRTCSRVRRPSCVRWARRRAGARSSVTRSIPRPRSSPSFSAPSPDRRGALAMPYVLISPCRDEADYMRETLDSVVAQSLRPAKWVIVDDGSTDDTPRILAEYARRHEWIEIVTRSDRGRRSVGPGVVDAFYAGYERINPDHYEYLCKLD